MYDTLYGWLNGELYKLNPKVRKLHLDPLKRYPIVKNGRVLAKHLHEITEPIYFSHTDTEKSRNAYRPALDSHGLVPGRVWRNMKKEFITIKSK